MISCLTSFDASAEGEKEKKGGCHICVKKDFICEEEMQQLFRVIQRTGCYI